MKKNYFLVMTLLAALAFLSSAHAGCEQGELVIKFSHVSNADKHPKGIAASLLEERVNQEMNGIACMQVFPNSTLYDDNKVLEAVLNQDVQLAVPSLSKFEKFTKRFRIFDLPFLFRDIDAVDRFQNSESGQILKDSMVRRGLKGLAFWHGGMKQMSANQPLVHPEDARGLKFRVQISDVLVAQFQELGANPQKMAFKEVYGALQTKVIDGQENTWSNIYTKKFFEVQDGVTETNHGIIGYLVVTSDEWWEQLPAEIRDPLATILQEVSAQRNREVDLVNRENRQKILDAGSEIRTLDEAQRNEWVTAMKPVWDRFAEDIGAEMIQAAEAAN